MLKYVKSFFFSDGKPQPVYLYIFILLTLVIAMVIMRMCEVGNFSDMLILGMCGFIVSWSGIITAGKRIGKAKEEMQGKFDELRELINGGQQ